MTEADYIRETIRIAKVFNLSLADLEHAAAYAESAKEWHRVVDEVAVAANG